MVHHHAKIIQDSNILGHGNIMENHAILFSFFRRKRVESKQCIIAMNCYIIQLLPLCEGNMTICSPEAGNIA